MKKCLILIIILFTALGFKPADAKNIEVIARITPPNPDVSGIAVTGDSRIFLSFPRHADNHKMPSLAEYVNGKLIPFPNKKMTMPAKTPNKDWLVSPHGITIDTKNRLWVIDNGKLAGIDGIEQGAAKIVCFDIITKQIVENIPILPPVLNQDSHLNDLRIDLNHGAKGTAYITNSSFGTTPSIIVVDIANAKSREVLINHISTKNQQGYMTFLEGKAHTYNPQKPTFPTGGADGIALVNNKVYWTTLTGRGLYSISADILSDFSKTEKEIQNAVKYEGDRPSCDGIAEDTEGNIYFGAYEQQAIVKRTSNGKFYTIVKDEDIGWPDALAYSNGFIYVTLGQWNRLPSFNSGKDLRIPPFLIMKVNADK